MATRTKTAQQTVTVDAVDQTLRNLYEAIGVRRYATEHNVVLTPALAMEWLARYTYGDQRNIVTNGLEQFVQSMKDGVFLPSVVVFCSVGAEGHDECALDLYHRCHSVIKSDCSILVDIHRYVADDEAARSRLFELFNGGIKGTPQSKFTSEFLDRVGIHSATDAALLESCDGWIKGGLTARAVRCCATEATHRRHQFVEEWAEEGKLFFHALSNSKSTLRKPFRRKPVAAVFFVLFRDYPEQMANLINTVLGGRTLPDDSPAMHLRKLIEAQTANAKGRPRATRDLVLMKQVAVCAVAHIEGKAMAGGIRLPKVTDGIPLPGSGFVVGG